MKKAIPSVPKPPKHLKKATKAWWLGIVEAFELEETHVRLLTMAGESWDRCQQAREAIRKHGLTYVDHAGNPRARPECAIERDSRVAFARLVRELALDVSEPADNRPPAIGGNANLRGNRP